MNYSEMLKNEHFLTFANILRRFYAKDFAGALVYQQHQRLLSMKGNAAGWPQMADFFSEFLDFLAHLVEANGLEPLYTIEDLNWLVGLFSTKTYEENEEVRAVISLMFAVGSTN